MARQGRAEFRGRGQKSHHFRADRKEIEKFVEIGPSQP